ncbi:MAG: flagellar hook-basal body protein [Campylobacterota bacterium]|nr:flagellar hook-basal body protein [Campylobacterota bacterium]
MQNGYYASAGGMVAQFNRLDTITNNLANVNTAGYKKDALITGDFMRLYKEARDELPNANQTVEGAQFYQRTMARVPQITDHYTDHSAGSLQQTGNTFDFALKEDAVFFAVKTPQGIRLTRDGIFTMNDDGKLVTKQGYEVLPSDYFETGNAIAFNVQDSIIEADKNGKLYMALPGTVQMVQSSQLMILQPENLRTLEKEGDGLFRADDIESMMIAEESGAVMQGFVEKSNVNPIKEMIGLIEAQRMVEMYQKAMDTQMNDLNRDAIEKLAYKK